LYGNEPSGSVKGGRFLDYMSDCYLLKNCSMALGNGEGL